MGRRRKTAAGVIRQPSRIAGNAATTSAGMLQRSRAIYICRDARRRQKFNIGNGPKIDQFSQWRRWSIFPRETWIALSGDDASNALATPLSGGADCFMHAPESSCSPGWLASKM
jgi:hypothetical protein